MDIFPKKQTQTLVREKVLTDHESDYHVILLDDDAHTYDYVVEMLMKVFGHSREEAFEMTCEVDAAGFVVVYTTSRRKAEDKVGQVHGYGPDWRIPNCAGGMSAIAEPADLFD